MNILSWLVLGLIAGGLAKMLTPGKQRGGCLTSIILGIIGAFVGGLISTQLGYGNVEQFDLRSLGIALVGSLLVLFIMGIFKRKR